MNTNTKANAGGEICVTAIIVDLISTGIDKQCAQ